MTDPQGAAIPEAVVTLRSTETSASRRAVTDGTGAFLFPAIVPGAYVLETQRPGFRTSTVNIKVQVDLAFTADIKLEVGQVTETVNVSADATTVNTQDATVGNPFTETQIRQLPLQTRNVVELLSVQPGVTATGEVLGARRDQNNVTLDGVDINDNQRAGIVDAGSGQGFNGNVPGDAGLTAALPLPLDSLQEFRVTVAGQGANQGRSAGGQVTLVTKSGTNSFHGSLYEFNRNTALTANNWFSNRARIRREALVRNQFGASLGGRIIKDRAFFFVNWERRIDASGQAVNRTVPTETLKQGILRFRQSDGTIGQLTPNELRSLDPLSVGVNPAVQNLLRNYPAGNDPNLGADRGLNFTGLRFNAPFRRDDNAYVAKLDFNIDKSGKHTAFVRGTLADGSQDALVAQFPGQDPASKQLDNSRGISARYIAVLSPSLVNNFTYGFTRLGIARSGVPGTQLSFDSISDPVNFGARAFGRIIPTHNISNDATWTKGAHTVQFGINFRFIRNDRSSFQNSFPSYSFSRSTLRGLGQDMENVINPFIQQRSGNPALRMTEPANAIRGLGVLYGLINQYSATYNFERSGQAVPFGQPVARAFRTNEYEFYIQDSWRARRDLTLTYGVRYSNSTPPWEANGIQVNSTVGFDTFFAQRVGAALAGQSGASTPSAALTYQLAGPVNGQPSWFRRDMNNWAPRFNMAYAPVGDSIFHKLFGKGAVLRVGGSMVYDRYGNDLVVEFDRTGSPGLATQVTQPRNTNFTDSARFGAALPTLPAAPAANFPFTPPTILGGFNSQVAVSPNVVAPYSFLLNASYARPIKGNYSLEVGYVGRLSRKQLLQQDFFQPLSIFRDAQSGQNWIEAAGLLRSAFDRGLTAAQNRSNPALIGRVPFFENMFPGLAGLRMPGNATANFFDLVFNEYAGSFTDALNDVDRERIGPGGGCLSRLGCNTFFALQNAGLRAWTNAGNGAFHGGTLTFRRTVTRGFGFDFNYTLAHSIDYASAAESGAGNGGAALQDAFNPRAFRGASDFDIRHNVTANGIYELPFGKGQKFLSGSNKFVNQLVAGWQISSLVRMRSGLP
ncbi:MAG: carboxypeptidase-like regulatory domain-containing protein, partial [Bryobacteraceae bacterium]|nr:carboxypeptidase-like regulatory domain-containing protein [Bryobacteraceae bacterium]